MLRYTIASRTYGRGHTGGRLMLYPYRYLRRCSDHKTNNSNSNNDNNNNKTERSHPFPTLETGRKNAARRHNKTRAAPYLQKEEEKKTTRGEGRGGSRSLAHAVRPSSNLKKKARKKKTCLRGGFLSLLSPSPPLKRNTTLADNITLIWTLGSISNGDYISGQSETV